MTGARLNYADTPMNTLINADALIIVTEWKEFRAPDFEMIKSCLKVPVIFDGRNMYNPDKVEEAGLEYVSIGRGVS